MIGSDVVSPGCARTGGRFILFCCSQDIKGSYPFLKALSAKYLIPSQSLHCRISRQPYGTLNRTGHEQADTVPSHSARVTRVFCEGHAPWKRLNGLASAPTACSWSSSNRDTFWGKPIQHRIVCIRELFRDWRPPPDGSFAAVGLGQQAVLLFPTAITRRLALYTTTRPPPRSRTTKPSASGELLPPSEIHQLVSDRLAWWPSPEIFGG